MLPTHKVCSMLMMWVVCNKCLRRVWPGLMFKEGVVLMRTQL